MLTKTENNKTTIALAGQPNTGKSTIFNYLTGSKQHVGNWPGKTIEKKEGWFVKNDSQYNVIDLPGTYSLTANSQEELIARNFVVNETPNLIVVVVDASQLERSFYMAAEVIALGMPVVVALNMMDIAKNLGNEIDSKKLESILGVSVIPMSASKSIGFDELIYEIGKHSSTQETPLNKADFYLNEEFSLKQKNIEKLISSYDLPDNYQAGWLALKILEADNQVIEMVEEIIGENEFQKIKQDYEIDDNNILKIAGIRFEKINQILSDCITKDKERTKKMKGFDRIATNPMLGSILGIAAIFSGFVLSAVLGFLAISILKFPVNYLGGLVESGLGSFSPILADLISQGLIPGMYLIFSMSAFVFGVLFLIGFLEDVGYLPRMAYVADIFMNRIGLHGKSFMPLFMGFGCNIAAVMGTRVIDSSRQRFLTIFLSSIIPCPGILITCAFIISIFFTPIAGALVMTMAAGVILHLLITSLFIGKSFIPGKSSGMIMELPPFHKPNFQTIINYTWLHYKGFIKKGGTLIASIIIIVWALTYFPNGSMDDSYLAGMGKFFEPIGSLMGMDWKLLTCLFVAFFSKEAALASIGVIYGLNPSEGSLMSLIMGGINGGSSVEQVQLASFIAQSISKPSALAFIFAVLFSVPCYATIGAIYFETKSLKWTLGSTIYYTFSSLVWGIAAYNIGLLIF